MQIREDNKNALKSLISPDPKDINIGKVIVSPSITNKAPKIFKRLLIFIH